MTIWRALRTTTRRQSLIASLAAALSFSSRAASASAEPLLNEVRPMQLSIYLLFDGDCAHAMEFYRTVLNGTLTLTTVGQSPMSAMFPPAMHNRVVNARLTGEHFDISASDWLRPTETPTRGNTVCLYLSGGTPDETRRLFQALSEGANITDPISQQPYGVYGALNDKFGVRWMFHAEQS